MKKKKSKKVYLLYEGSYRNNERYSGKEYDRDNNVRFEGEFKNGEYNYGKEYYNNKDLKFKGEYKNGKYFKGKEYYDNDEVSNMYSFLDKYSEKNKELNLMVYIKKKKNLSDGTKKKNLIFMIFFQIF